MSPEVKMHGEFFDLSTLRPFDIKTLFALKTLFDRSDGFFRSEAEEGCLADEVAAGGRELGNELVAGRTSGFYDDHSCAGAGGEETGVAEFEDGFVGGGGGNFQLLGQRPDGREFFARGHFPRQHRALDGFHELVGNWQAIEKLESERKHGGKQSVSTVTARLIHSIRAPQAEISDEFFFHFLSRFPVHRLPHSKTLFCVV
jgi:hypothetical protein